MLMVTKNYMFCITVPLYIVFVMQQSLAKVAKEVTTTMVLLGKNINRLANESLCSTAALHLSMTREVKWHV